MLLNKYLYSGLEKTCWLDTSGEQREAFKKLGEYSYNQMLQ
jgi:hypothetical protein